MSFCPSESSSVPIEDFLTARLRDALKEGGPKFLEDPPSGSLEVPFRNS